MIMLIIMILLISCFTFLFFTCNENDYFVIVQYLY